MLGCTVHDGLRTTTSGGTMPIDEQRRHALHGRLIDVLGEEHALTLISHLPPAGWAEVATRRDLDQLGDRLRAEMHATVTAQTRTLFFGMLASNATLVALAFAAARLT
jgi:hypothetical protein